MTDENLVSEAAAVKSVLFVCNQNAVRSPMAEALANKHCKRRIFVDSVGLIAGNLDPFSVAAMQEEGADISNHVPSSLQTIDAKLFDLVIALTPESHERMQKMQSKYGFKLEHWPTSDPSDAIGNRDQVMGGYRSVRDELSEKIVNRFVF